MGAGAGAQKITTDVTGNDTAGMVAGMVASGMTAKGLNGIEAGYCPSIRLRPSEPVPGLGDKTSSTTRCG